MEISCELKTYDLTQAARLVLLRKPLFRLFLAFVWTLPLAAFGLGAALALGIIKSAPPFMQRHPESFMSLILILAIVAAFKLSAMTSVAGPISQTVQAGPDGIIVTRPQGQFETPWAGIQEITYLRGEVFLVPKAPLLSTDLNTRLINIPIPKRLFVDDTALEAFLLEVRGFWKAVGNSEEPGDSPQR